MLDAFSSLSPKEQLNLFSQKQEQDFVPSTDNNDDPLQFLQTKIDSLLGKKEFLDSAIQKCNSQKQEIEQQISALQTSLDIFKQSDDSLVRLVSKHEEKVKKTLAGSTVQVTKESSDLASRYQTQSLFSNPAYFLQFLDLLRNELCSSYRNNGGLRRRKRTFRDVVLDEIYDVFLNNKPRFVLSRFADDELRFIKKKSVSDRDKFYNLFAGDFKTYLINEYLFPYFKIANLSPGRDWSLLDYASTYLSRQIKKRMAKSIKLDGNKYNSHYRLLSLHEICCGLFPSVDLGANLSIKRWFPVEDEEINIFLQSLKEAGIDGGDLYTCWDNPSSNPDDAVKRNEPDFVYPKSKLAQATLFAFYEVLMAEVEKPNGIVKKYNSGKSGGSRYYYYPS